MNPVLDVPAIAHFTLNHPGKQLTDEAVEAPSGTALLWAKSRPRGCTLRDACIWEYKGQADPVQSRQVLEGHAGFRPPEAVGGSGRGWNSPQLLLALHRCGREAPPPPPKNVLHTKFHLRVSFLGDPTDYTQ